MVFLAVRLQKNVTKESRKSDTKWKEGPHQQMFYQDLNVANSKQRAEVLKHSGVFHYSECSVFSTRSGSGLLAATWWVKCL